MAGVGGPTFGKLGDVQTNDQAAFLPATAEATRALEWQAKFRTSDAIPAVVVIAGESALDQDRIKDVAASLKDLHGSGRRHRRTLRLRGRACRAAAGAAGWQRRGRAAVATLRAELADRIPEGTRAYVTGPAGFSADLVEAFGGIDGVLLGVALGAVFLILLLVYRSVLLPLTVLFTAVAALCAAILAVYFMAKEGWIRLDGQSQGILSILVIGAATDYSLLLVARHKEALAGGQDRWEAVASPHGSARWSRSWPPAAP